MSSPKSRKYRRALSVHAQIIKKMANVRVFDRKYRSDKIPMAKGVINQKYDIIMDYSVSI